MHGRSRFRTRARGSGAALSPFLFQASTYGATDAWDFVNDQYIRGGLLSDGGVSITRNSVGSAQTADGRIVTFGANELRRTDKGILVEGARTNLFLNSLVGATQTITVTAVAHTLSFYGTGTITLSGTSTAGPLIGTGAGQRVTLTFTPTAGSLTLTVSGTVEYAQLEVGAFASSWIPTEGTSVARAADQVTAVPTAGTDYPLTLFAEIERVVDTNDVDAIACLDTGNGSNEALLYVTSDRYSMLAETGSSLQAVSQVSVTLNTTSVYKGASRVAADNFISCLNGTLDGLDTSGTAPNTPTRILIGSRHTGNPFFGFLRRFAIIPRALSDVELQGITT